MKIKNLKYHLSLAAVLMLASVCVYAVFFSFLAGDRTFLFRDIGSDSVNIAYPSYCQASIYLHRYGFQAWSAHQGVGQAFSGVTCGDPFVWPIILQSNPVSIAIAIGAMEAIKCLAAILLFAAFLRCAGVCRLALLFGALSYGLSGYLILGACWSVFSTEAVYLALLLLATERFIRYGSLWLIPVPICLLGMLQPFYYWGFGLFTLAYILMRLAEQRAETSSVRTGVSTEIRKIMVFGAVSAIGVLAASTFLLSSLNLMLQSPRIGGDASYVRYLLNQPLLQLASQKEIFSALYRTLSTDMLGVGSGFTGYINYLEAPVFYCGLFTLLLIPQLFIMCEKRLRVLYGGVLTVVLLPVFFPWIRYAFWFFQGDYYRLLSLFITTTLILLGVRGLTRIEAGGRMNIVVLASSIGLIMVFLFIFPAERFEQHAIPGRDITLPAPPPEYKNLMLLDKSIRNMVISLMVGYAMLLTVWAWINGRTQAAINRPAPTQYAANLVKGVFLALAVLETIWFARTTLNDRPVVTKASLHQKINYNDYTVDTLAVLRSKDRTPFYRINKDYSSGPAIHGSLNDAMVQDFYGTTCYTQFNQLDYIRFLNVVGVLEANKEYQTRWCVGLTQRPLLQIWASTKYCLTKTPLPYREAVGEYGAYDEIATCGDVTAFQYRQFLPLGFTYDKFIDPEFFTALPAIAKDAILLQAVVVGPADQPALAMLSHYSPMADAAPFDLNTCVATLRKDVLTLDTFQPDHFSGHIELERNKLLFFSIPFDRGWQLTVDGRPAKLLKVNIGFMGLVLSPGRHTLEMQYKPPLLVPGLILSGCGLTIYLFLIMFKMKMRLRHA